MTSRRQFGSEWPPTMRRIRLVGSCIIGTLLAAFPAALVAKLTAENQPFFVFFVCLAPFAVAFSLLIEAFWTLETKSGTEAFQEHLRKRYKDGIPPVGE